MSVGGLGNISTLGSLEKTQRATSGAESQTIGASAFADQLAAFMPSSIQSTSDSASGSSLLASNVQSTLLQLQSIGSSTAAAGTSEKFAPKEAGSLDESGDKGQAKKFFVPPSATPDVTDS